MKDPIKGLMQECQGRLSRGRQGRRGLPCHWTVLAVFWILSGLATPIRADECSVFDGQTESFEFTPPKHERYMGKCTEGATVEQGQYLGPEQCIGFALSVDWIKRVDTEPYVLIRPQSNQNCLCKAAPQDCVYVKEKLKSDVCGVSSGQWSFSSCKTAPPNCPYSAGSGKDCTPLLCATGNIYFFATKASRDQFVTAGGGTAHPNDYCPQNSAIPGEVQTMFVACSSSAPTPPLYDSCTNNPDIKPYYTNAGGSCTRNSTTCSGFVPPPPPGNACDLNRGGAGRSCSDPSDCCSGYTCEIAGAQPMFWSADDGTKVVGVKFRSGYSYTPTPPATHPDPIASSVLPVGGSEIFKTTGPSKICVGPSPTPTPADDKKTSDYYPLPWALDQPTPLVQTEAIKWDGSAFRCMFQSGDKYRDTALHSCRCQTPVGKYGSAQFLPVLVTGKTYQKIQNLKFLGQAPSQGPVQGPVQGPGFRVRQLWALKRSAIQSSFAKSARAAWEELIPNACAADPPTDLLFDRGTVNKSASAVEWSPWLSASQNYGVSMPGAIRLALSAATRAPDTSDETAINVLTCVPQCPANSTQCRVENRDATAPCNPAECKCNNPNDYFDRANWTCSPCPKEGQYADPSIQPPDPLVPHYQCRCPENYELIKVSGIEKCRPKTPREMMSLGLDAYYRDGDGYPVCGGRRLPVSYQLQIMNFASTGVPHSSLQTTGTSYPAPYPYSSPTPAAVGPSPSPFYLYWDQPHCACSSGATAPSTAASNTREALSSTVGSGLRFYPDTLDAIASRGSDGKPDQAYGEVALPVQAGLAFQDPREGKWFNTAQAFCGCPNVNERPVYSGSDHSQSGPRCVSAIESPPERLLFSTFDRIAHQDAILLNPQPVDGSGLALETINIPRSQDETQTFTYRRGIWLCQPGYTLKRTSPFTCDFDSTANACNSTSEVSHRVSGSDYAARFSNSVNPKAGCCGYQFGPSSLSNGTLIKFDCVANEGQFNSFDPLWASADSAADGGNLNLLVLADKSGKELTGWYRLDGSRCDQFGSVAPGEIRRGLIRPELVNGPSGTVSGPATFTPKSGAGSTIPVPTSNRYGELIAGLNGNTTGLSRAVRPQPETGSAADIRNGLSCPIYVRAAAVYGCDRNGVRSSPVKTIEESAGKVRCAAAARTLIHFRVEQVFEIQGTRTIPTQDTVLEESQVKQITLKALWEVNGFGTCPPPAKRVGDACVW